MANIRDIPELIDPAFIDSNPYAINDSGNIHISGEVDISAIPIGNGFYEIGRFIVNGNGDILAIKK